MKNPFKDYQPGTVCTGTIHALGLDAKRLIARGVIIFDEQNNDYIFVGEVKKA